LIYLGEGGSEEPGAEKNNPVKTASFPETFKP